MRSLMLSVFLLGVVLGLALTYGASLLITGGI